MKLFYKILLAIALLIAMPSAKTFAKVKQTPLHMFGVAVSFTDSVAYITDIHYVDSVTLDAKSKFIMDRNLYSAQLQRHIAEEKGIHNITTAVFYNQKKAKLAKKYARVCQKLEKDKGVRLSTINFHMKSEEWIEPEVLTETKKAKKNKKSKK